MRRTHAVLFGVVMALAVAAIGLHAILGDGARWAPAEAPIDVEASGRPARVEAVETASSIPLREETERAGTESGKPSVDPGPVDAKPPAAKSRGLAAAVDFLRAAHAERFGSLTLEEAAALVDLDLRGASITDADLAHLAALPALESVSFYGTAITDDGLVHLYSLPHLDALDFRGTVVTAAGISLLPAHGLEALHLTDTHVAGNDLAEFPPMPNLNRLKLNRLEFGDEHVSDLALFPRVEHLELDGTRITDEGLGRLLAQNATLKRVELRSTRVSPEGVARLRETHPEVELVIDDGANGMYAGWR